MGQGEMCEIDGLAREKDCAMRELLSDTSRRFRNYPLDV